MYGCFYEIINCDAKELNILTYTYFFEKIKFVGCLVNKTVKRRLLIEKKYELFGANSYLSKLFFRACT